MTNPELAPEMPDYELMLLIETAKKYDRRECFADSGNGFSASMEYSNMLKALQTRTDLAPQAGSVDVEVLRNELRGLCKQSPTAASWHFVDMVIDHLASRPVDAALKSPPECEIEETQEQKRLKWNIKVIPECLDAIERKEGRAREIAQIQFCVIHGDNIREICNAALPHCPDGLRLAQLVLQIDKAAREEGLYIGGGYNPKLAKSEQEGPMWKAIKELAGLIAAAEGKDG